MFYIYFIIFFAFMLNASETIFPIMDFPPAKTSQIGSNISAKVLSNDERYLAIYRDSRGCGPGDITVFDLQNCERKFYVSDISSVQSFIFSQDSQKIIVFRLHHASFDSFFKETYDINLYYRPFDGWVQEDQNEPIRENITKQDLIPFDWSKPRSNSMLTVDKYFPKHEWDCFTYLFYTKEYNSYQRPILRVKGNYPLFVKNNTLLITHDADKVYFYDISFLHDNSVRDLINNKLSLKQIAFLTLLEKYYKKWQERMTHLETIAHIEIEEKRNVLPTIHCLSYILHDQFHPVITKHLIEKYKILDAEQKS